MAPREPINNIKSEKQKTEKKNLPLEKKKYLVVVYDSLHVMCYYTLTKQEMRNPCQQTNPIVFFFFFWKEQIP